MTAQLLPPSELESDDSLRRVYGAHATFDRVGTFTLVHLDSPSPELRQKRTAEFNPDEYFFDNCPLCQHARDNGGHIIFDASSDTEWDGDDRPGIEAEHLDPNVDTPTNADAFAEAIRELSAAAIEFDDRAKSLVPEWLADRVGFDVLILADSIQSVIEGGSVPDLQAIPEQIRRAYTTVAAAAHEAAYNHATTIDCTRINAALDAVASTWNAI